MRTSTIAIASAIAATITATTAASAAITAAPFAGGDAGFNALTNNGALAAAAAETRIGNAQSEAGSWEVAIWEQGGGGTPEDQAGRAIANGVTVPFTLTYDGASTVTFTVDGAMTSWSGVASTFTDIFIRTRSVSNTSITLDNLLLDGTPIPTASSTGNSVDYLRIQNMGMPFGAFTLTGDQTLGWTGSRPNNSALAAQLKLSNVIPAPGALALAGSAGLATTRRRR